MKSIQERYKLISIETRLKLLNAAHNRIRQCGFNHPADHLPTSDIKEVVVNLNDLITLDNLSVEQATSFFINTTTLTANGQKCIVFNC